MSSKGVPYYDMDAIGGPVAVFQDQAERIVDRINRPGWEDCDAALNYSGDSMYPKYVSGDIIAVKQIKDFSVVQLGEDHLVVTDEQRMVKTVRKGADKRHWTLTNYNPNYDSFEIEIAKVKGLFIIRGSSRLNNM